MKTFKQLICFIVPTAVIWALICVTSFIPSDSLPGFLQEQDYLSIYFKDSFLFKDFVSTLVLPCCFVLLTGLMIYVVKTIMIRKSCGKSFNKTFYAVAFTVCSALFYFSSGIKAYLGIPPSAYSVHTIISGIDNYRVNLPAILLSMQVGIIVCFLFWLTDKIMIKTRK
ncbi:hypothetical protein EOM82_09965 [bacterium]|nr:hypothetical protein [bacterium]